MKNILSFFALIIFFFSNFGTVLSGTTVAEINIGSERGKVIPDIVSNVNVWDMGSQFYFPAVNEENNIYDFVKYVQFMQCIGGTPERDLFVDPYDTDVLNDYDFTPLIKNCRGVLSVGAKPLLKLGGVPCKFSKDYVYSNFGMNLYPPDDYNVFYDYIKAMAIALVDEFGIDEVRTWRFGTLTEYENADWFQARSGKGADTAVEFCKIYDYTVQALTDVLGDDICVGAHSMTVTKGLWDCELFIKHIAQGTNYANGLKGTHISYLSASFYDSEPGKFTKGYTLPETVKKLKSTAEKYGLNDLFYGVDEGRILSGNASGSEKSDLLSRICGDTYQAAYDARLYISGINSGLDYFSSWMYFSEGLTNGNPSVSYHIADKISELAGSHQLDADVKKVSFNGDEVGCIAGKDETDGTVRVMAYNFKNKISYNKKANLKFNVNVDLPDGENVTVTQYLINDDCNWFDEWREDRVKYNITDDCFGWSPDDPCISGSLTDNDAKNIYYSVLEQKYKECSYLNGTKETVTVKNGQINLNKSVDGNSVIYLVIG